MKIQINPHNVIVDKSNLTDARAEFAERHCILLRQVIEPDLLARLLKQLAAAPIYERVHRSPKGKEIAKELSVEGDALIVRAFKMLFNSPSVFKFMEELTDCATIGSLLGRIYIMRPDPEHHSLWHGDDDGNRMLGMSLNLSGKIYSGGVFQIRERGTENLSGEIANNGLGDLHIFRINSTLQHHVTPVTGKITKTAFAGWFCAEPKLTEMYFRSRQQ